MIPSLMLGGDETIVALATAPGRGAVAVIRLSGARAMMIARALGVGDLTGRHATRVRLTHPTTSAFLDDALVTWFVAPRSYTGEDVVELATHGGSIAPRRVLAACVAAGARPALPGEFTRRAVLHGKLDLVQAEAVAELIDARTQAAHQQALVQLDGGLSRRFLALREELIHLEALLAYDVDFPDEDDGPIDRVRIAEAAESVHAALDALLRSAPQGARLRDGALVVLAGAPNAGKSSLFNALLGEARALVTPIAGTTRDAIDAVLDRLPVPLRLVDTAGLRDPTDELERLGIEVSTRYLAQAQVVLVCGTEPEALATAIAEIAPRTPAVLVPVLTKSDLRDAVLSDAVLSDAVLGDAVLGDGVLGAATVPAGAYVVSAETGVGLEALLAGIDDAVRSSAAWPDECGGLVVTRERHRLGLETAAGEIADFLSAWRMAQLPATVAAVHLLAARQALEDLIGVVDVEDVLDRVFREFCIGK